MQRGGAGHRNGGACSRCVVTRFFHLPSQLCRSSRIPELGGFVPACRQDPSTVGTKRRPPDSILMVKGGDELARGRIPEFGGVVCARRQDPSAVRTKRRVVDTILMVKGGDQLARGRIPELGGFVRARRQDPSTVRTKRRFVDLS